MSTDVADTLEFLLGRWSIERSIDDRTGGVAMTFRGTATVKRGGAGARYEETGQVRRGDHVGPARRSLDFIPQADGRVRVDFLDGHRFLDLDLGAGRCRATHPCRADVYEMDYEVLDADRIRETWHVRGPEKDYEAETIWRRLR